MVSDYLLSILVCPESKQRLTLAENLIIEDLNKKISKGELKNLNGDLVKQKLEAGLIRQDKSCLYPIIDGIPVMLSSEAIAVN